MEFLRNIRPRILWLFLEFDFGYREMFEHRSDVFGLAVPRKCDSFRRRSFNMTFVRVNSCFFVS